MTQQPLISNYTAEQIQVSSINECSEMKRIMQKTTSPLTFLSAYPRLSLESYFMWRVDETVQQTVIIKNKREHKK